MRFFIIPLGFISRKLRHGATRVLGENEVRSLENDIFQPILTFIDEVYEDSVGEVKAWILRKRKQKAGWKMKKPVFMLFLAALKTEDGENK